MHILLGILAAVGVIGVIIYRLVLVAQAGRTVAEAAGEAHKFVRRTHWRYKRDGDPLDPVDDPRVAAAAILAAVVEVRRVMNADQEAKVIVALRRAFEVSQSDAGEFLAEGRWLAKDAANLDVFMGRLTPVILAATTETERAAFADLVEDTIAAGGPATDLQKDAVARLRGKLLPG
jgi:uncharacterized tellurite resistance protein B-like protein